MTEQEEKKLRLCAQAMSITGLESEVRFAEKKCKEHDRKSRVTEQYTYWSHRRQIFLAELDSRYGAV